MAIKYVQVEYDHLKSMSRGMALYFGYLRSLDDYLRQKESYKKYGGWQLSVKKAASLLGISESSQKRYLKMFEDTGLIEVVTGGFKNRRKLRVIYDEDLGSYVLTKVMYLPKIGVTDSIFTSYIEWLAEALADKGKVAKDGFFFFCFPKAEENIGYPIRLQKEILKRVSDLGLVETKDSETEKSVLLRVKKEMNRLPDQERKTGSLLPLVNNSVSFLCQGLPF